MGIETFTYISSLNTSYPLSTDLKSEGDDHLRGIKTAVKASFPNVAGAVTADHTELSYVDGVTSAIQTQLNALSSGKVSTTDALLKGQPRLLQTQTLSAQGQCDFVNGVGGAVIDSTYDVYLLEIIKLVPGTGATTPYLRTSTNAGSSYDAGVSDYRTDYRQVRSGTATAGGAAAAQMTLSGAQTLATTSWLNGRIFIYRPSAADRCAFQGELIMYDNSSVMTIVSFGGMRDTAADVDAIRIIMSSGTISGTFNLYGIVK